jgi:GT2 family glycosyltransferase
MNMELPATSLIICTRNRPRLLSDTVDSVLAGHEVPTEIVIIDQSAQPHPALAALKPDQACAIQYVWSHSIGLSCARNEGLRAAHHEWIAIIDDDMYVHADWFGALMRALIEASPCAVVTGQVQPSESEVAGGFVPSTIEDQTPAVYRGRILIEVLSAGNMALHCSAIKDVGLFDERLGAGSAFRSAEDNDLGYRLLEAGYRVLYVPEAIVYHRAWRSTREYMPLRWSYGFGRGAFFAKHLNRHDGFMLRRMLKAFGQYTGRLIRYVPVRSRRQTLGDAVFILGMFSGSMKWLLTQTRSN